MPSFDFNPKTGKARFFFRYDRRQFNKTIGMSPSGTPTDTGI